MNKMKKILWTMVCLCVALGAAAQQFGIVRTLERPGKPSVGITGVTINVMEYPNAVVSKKGGKFSFVLDGKRQGESFTVTRVQKKGYTLVDKQLKGRRYAYSASVPIEIVMVADEQLEQDKKRIEDKAYSKAKKNYDQKVAALEEQLNKKTISEREYRAKYEELSNNYNNYVQLIDQMAERYATTDYTGMSDISRKIQECIENSDLEQANELINSKGDFDKREQELTSKMELKEKSEQLAQQLQDDIDKEIEDLAQDYYNKYTICASNYQNDSAAYYLERILRLYPTNASWLFYAAGFIDGHLADYPKAIKYLNQAYTYGKEQYGEISANMGRICTYLGLSYDHNDQPDSALVWHHKALDILTQAEDVDSTDISMSYTLIGRAYGNKMEYDKALEYTKKGLEIRERAPEKDYGYLGQSYNNLGWLAAQAGDYNQALEYHNKALEYRLQKYGPNNDVTAVSYSHIASCNAQLENNDLAIEYYSKAIEIYQRVYGPTHPWTCGDLYYLARTYRELKDDEKALDCYHQALSGYDQHYGEPNDNSAYCHCGIASILLRQGDYDKAMEEFKEFLSFYETKYGNESAYAAWAKDIIAEYLNENGYTIQAIEYYQQALSIYEKTPNVKDEDLDKLRNTIRELKEKTIQEQKP
jgi:tetratricopeptide (TPR) repeat protein